MDETEIRGRERVWFPRMSDNIGTAIQGLIISEPAQSPIEGFLEIQFIGLSYGPYPAGLEEDLAEYDRRMREFHKIYGAVSTVMPAMTLGSIFYDIQRKRAEEAALFIDPALFSEPGINQKINHAVWLNNNSSGICGSKTAGYYDGHISMDAPEEEAVIAPLIYFAPNHLKPAFTAERTWIACPADLPQDDVQKDLNRLFTCLI